MITDQSPPGSKMVRPPVVYYLLYDLFLSRFVPGALFALIASAKTSSLIARLGNAASGSHLDLNLFVYSVQQIAGITFAMIVAFLFVTRRPIIGSHSSIINALVALVGSFLLTVPVGAKVAEDNTAALALSAVFVIAGASFTVVSLVALGRCFGVLPEARGLVTSGPYRFIRHPIYVAEIITSFGLVVGTMSLPFGVLLVANCGLQYWRARNEEAALRVVFSEYDDYCHRTPRFLPRLRRSAVPPLIRKG